MPTPRDKHAAGVPDVPSPAVPDALLAAVRARRRVVVRRRATGAGAVLGLAVVIGVSLPSHDRSEPLPAGLTIASGPPTMLPAITPASMASMRRQWSDRGVLPGQDTATAASTPETLRMGDAPGLLGAEL